MTTEITDKEEITNKEGGIYSNFDHVLNEGVKEVLQNKPNECWSHHAAWDFCGYIWYDGKRWREEIWVYHSFQEVLEADTVEDLIEGANEKYGSR